MKEIECIAYPCAYDDTEDSRQEFISEFADNMMISEADAQKILEETPIELRGKEFRLIGKRTHFSTQDRYLYILKYIGGKKSEYTYYKVSSIVFEFFAGKI